MHIPISAIWQTLPEDLAQKLNLCLDSANDAKSLSGKIDIFFRSDDIAVPGDQFTRIMALFGRYRMPLALAVVPAWLTSARWRSLKSVAGSDFSLWSWHQHGWRHANHSREGKKAEFGENRPIEEIEIDLKKGRARLEKIMGEDFYPAFTPPWNRCGTETIDLVNKLGYRAISRSARKENKKPNALPEYSVNVDLHTRKEQFYKEGWINLFAEITESLASGFCGIMIHHRRMNDTAFLFLERFFEIIAQRKDLQTVSLQELVEREEK